MIDKTKGIIKPEYKKIYYKVRNVKAKQNQKMYQSGWDKNKYALMTDEEKKAYNKHITDMKKERRKNMTVE